MQRTDLDRLTVLDLLEQACERAVQNGIGAYPYIREAADRIIDEIEDPTVRNSILEEIDDSASDPINKIYTYK